MAELPTPHPLGETLPALFQEDMFTQRMCTALDEVLAPVVSTLDCMTAYFDPGTTPADMLEWLASWVGVAIDGTRSVERRRAMVREGMELHRLRGTVAGIERAVSTLYDEVPEVTESGGAGWSSDEHAGRLPGAPTPHLLVRLHVADPSLIDVRELDAVVAALKPAHVPHRVEVVERSTS